MELIDVVEQIKKYDEDADFELIEKAYQYAQMAHEGQKRISGEAYISHPIEVAYILTGIEMDTASICAALLHDVIEDTVLTHNEITREFGE